jgi:hypothetical protein
LPTGLLIDPRVQQVVIRNDTAAYLERLLTFEIFKASVAQFGLLLVGDQARSAEVFFGRVSVVMLEVGVFP